MKYIVVTGGVVSGLGKGITISSIGRLCIDCGLRITSIKIDPYLNTDAGTMSPIEHGEVYVLNDGGEVDLDLGNYERFEGVTLTRDHNITTGKVYNEVIMRERRGDYLGKTVQVVPHITDEIQNWMERVAQQPVDGQQGPPDVCLVEVGGTVGDIESSVFLEAMRQFQFRVGKENFCLIFVSLVPVLGSVGEQKTKPTQHGVKELRSLGLQPDIIICRSSTKVEDSTREKISVFCHVAPSHVLSVHDVSNIYHVPVILAEQKLPQILREQLKLGERMRAEPEMGPWRELAESVDSFTRDVKIAIVGKYTGLQDSYLSVIKALKHASIAEKRSLEICWVDSSDLEPATKEENPEKYQEAWAALKEVDGMVVPGGFGNRGVEGKLLAANYARLHKKPMLGVCLGMQVMVMEYARNMLGWKDATSEEFDKEAKTPVVVFMPEINPEVMGGTMRLGQRATCLRHKVQGEESIASRLYDGADEVLERHRHRYEVNPDKVDELEAAGLKFVGKDETKTRMEIVELSRSVHPFYLGTQYHPEFQSRPLHPSPPFHGLLMAACGTLDAFLDGPASATGPGQQQQQHGSPN